MLLRPPSCSPKLPDRRFDSDFRTLQHLVSQDALGDVLEADIHFDFPDPGWISGWTQKEYIVGEGMAFGLGKSFPRLDLQENLSLTMDPRHPYSRPSSRPVWASGLGDWLFPVEPRC